MDKFNLKEFIVENRLGPISKLKEEDVDEGLEKGYFKKKFNIGEQKQRAMP